MTKNPTVWSANLEALTDLYAYDSSDHTYDSTMDIYDGTATSTITTKVPTEYTSVAKNSTGWADADTKNPTVWSDS